MASIIAYFRRSLLFILNNLQNLLNMTIALQKTSKASYFVKPQMVISEYNLTRKLGYKIKDKIFLPFHNHIIIIKFCFAKINLYKKNCKKIMKCRQRIKNLNLSQPPAKHFFCLKYFLYFYNYKKVQINF